MTLHNPLSHGRWAVIVPIAVLVSPLMAQNQYGAWPQTPSRYAAPNPNQYQRQYTPPASNHYIRAPASNRYSPAPATRPWAPARQPLRVAEQMYTATTSDPQQLQPAKSGEHPLMPALRWARGGLENIEKLQDYSATLVKRERIGDKIMDPEYMFIKIRHKPFSVYAYFLGPAKIKGQEVIYVDGQNDGKMLAHGVGFQQTMFGTLPLAPNGMIAMRGQRYPISEIGVLNLVRRLIQVAEADSKYGECEVKYYKGAKINNRVCTCIEVVHPVPRRNFLYHVARIFVDDELNIPIRFESHRWPRKPGGAPELLEEYTYLNLKLNNGFTDADFDIRNPNYRFR